MPRHPRRAEISNYFHIIVQGIEKKYIFQKAQYKNKYYELLMTKSQQFNIKILAYCVMDNHAHLLIYTEKITDLSLYMKVVNEIFAKMYNKIEKRVGYVFRDRFLSEPIISQRQLYNCLVYIHYNPVKAGMVKRLEQYNYSSYVHYLYRINVATEENIKLLFEYESDYLELFCCIHDIYYEYKFGQVNSKNNEKNSLKKMCKELSENEIPIRVIADKLDISKSKVQRLLKE